VGRQDVEVHRRAEAGDMDLGIRHAGEDQLIAVRHGYVET
jgi:hypothetical protein